MKTLIIPDIHGRSFWKKAIKKHFDECDHVVFLGDYIDPYGWEGISSEDAICNFQDIIEFAEEHKDKVTLLLGNHDITYISPYFLKYADGGRHDKSRHAIIEGIFKASEPLFHLGWTTTLGVKKYLFTHAGITSYWYEKYKSLIGDISQEKLDKLLHSEEGVRALCEVGQNRYGLNPTGSIVWADVYEHDQDNCEIDDYYQIFGHSQQETDPIIKDHIACLDCRKAFILTDEGIITDITD